MIDVPHLSEEELMTEYSYNDNETEEEPPVEDQTYKGSAKYSPLKKKNQLDLQKDKKIGLEFDTFSIP